MIRSSKINALRRAGVLVCGDDEFVFYKCRNCDAISLMNEELLQLYLNPADLSEGVLWATDELPVQCPTCHAFDDFVPLEDDERVLVLKSDWGRFL